MPKHREGSLAACRPGVMHACREDGFGVGWPGGALCGCGTQAVLWIVCKLGMGPAMVHNYLWLV